MDLQKIGAYIASKRKALGMTQTELAEKLGMSNKSVSKWERGVCLPDVSLYMELCDILGITINEFIAGEDLPEERFVEKSDENIISVTKDGKQRSRRLKLALGVLAIALALLMAVMVVLHLPRQNYIKSLPKDSTEMMAAEIVEFRIVVFPSEMISIRALCAHLNLAFGIRHLAFIGTINRNL